MITILTRKIPINISELILINFSKISIKNIKKFLRPFKKAYINKNIRFVIGKEFRGPHSVFFNLVHGFKKNDILFNHDPIVPNKIHDTVIVLSDIEALKQAIKLKKGGGISKLIAGPNITSSPFDILNLKDCNLIDTYIHPCQWYIDFWKYICPNFPIILSSQANSDLI